MNNFDKYVYNVVKEINTIFARFVVFRKKHICENIGRNEAILDK